MASFVAIAAVLARARRWPALLRPLWRDARGAGARRRRRLHCWRSPARCTASVGTPAALDPASAAPPDTLDEAVAAA